MGSSHSMKFMNNKPQKADSSQGCEDKVCSFNDSAWTNQSGAMNLGGRDKARRHAHALPYPTLDRLPPDVAQCWAAGACLHPTLASLQSLQKTTPALRLPHVQNWLRFRFSTIVSHYVRDLSVLTREWKWSKKILRREVDMKKTWKTTSKRQVSSL